MDFVAISTTIGTDRVTFLLADGLKISRINAVGHLTLLCAAMAVHAQDGDLSDVPDALLATWAGWTKKPEPFASIIRAQLCDTHGVVRAWDRWNGAMIRKAKHDRERKRQARARPVDRPRNVHGQSAPVPATGAGTVPDRTVPDLTTTTNYGDSASPTARGAASEGDKRPSTVAKADSASVAKLDSPANNWPARIADRWTAQVGLIQPGRVGKDLGPMIRTFGEAVVVRAVDSFATHRRLAVQAGAEKPDGWPQFVRDFADYVPKTVLAAVQARQEGPVKAPNRAQDATEAA